MARGKRRQPSHSPVRLSDSETRLRLAPPELGREALRRRLGALVAANAELERCRWWPDAAEPIEREIVDELGPNEAKAIVDELELLNARQQFAVLSRRWERLNGDLASLEREHLFDDGSTILRVWSAEDYEQLCDDFGCVDWPSSEARDFDVYALRDGEGVYQCLVAAVTLPAGENGLPADTMLVLSTAGLAPTWDDRGSLWHDAADDVVEARAGREVPLRDWFAHLRERGAEVRWARPQNWTLCDWKDLLAFYDQFRWSPGRFLDGFDGRLGIDGPLCEVSGRTSVADCVAWAADEAAIWGIDTRLLADALYVATVLLGESPRVALSEAITLSGERRAGGDDPDDEEQVAEVERFVGRLRQLVDEAGEQPDLRAPLPRR